MNINFSHSYNFSFCQEKILPSLYAQKNKIFAIISAIFFSLGLMMIYALHKHLTSLKFKAKLLLDQNKINFLNPEANHNLMQNILAPLKFTGEGKLFATDGSSYEGTFKDGLFIYGKMIDTEGTIAEGPFSNGKLNGPGTMTYANGMTCYGMFLNHELNGPGTIFYPEGEIGEGIFKNFQLYGKGKFKTSDEYWEGEFIGDNLNGKGKIICYDGNLNDPEKINDRIYEGTFKNNRLFGPGKLTIFHREIHEGIFEDDQLIKGKMTLTNGLEYKGTFKDGKLIQGTISHIPH